MEKSNKLMLGAALVVALVALAGAGYALTSYTATTTNKNNTMDTTYLVLSQSGTTNAIYDGEATILTNLFFDTVKTNATTTTYTPVGTYVKETENKYTTENTTGKEFALVSEGLSLQMTPTNSSATSATMKVTASNFSVPSGLTYTMILGSKDDSGAINVTSKAVITSGNVWNFENLVIGNSGSATTQNWGVFLLVSGTSSDGSSGFPVKDAESKTTFTFELTAQQ